MSEPAREQPPPPPDWTHGPAKWIAAVAIALVSIVGMVWSLVAWPGGASARPANTDDRQPLAPMPARDVAARPATPPSASSSPTTPKASPDAVPSSNATDATDADSTTSSPSTAPPATTPSSSAAPSTPSARADNSLVNINTATRAELELLPGIGPSLAQRIIEHREKFGAFHSVDELDRVKGIGSKILERLRTLVRVD